MTATVGVVTVASPTATSATSTGTTLFSQTFTTNSLSSTGGSLFIPGLPSGSGAPSNAACLTVPGSTANIPSCNGTSDSSGSGALQLTPASTTQEGGVFSTVSVPSTQGLDINFNTFQYNGTGADGIAFVLAATDPTNPQPPSAMGQSGGTLGYSAAPGASGLVNGYLGIGFDVFGNYSNGTYSGTGCGATPAFINPNGTVPGQVVVRGPGSTTSGYCPLYSTATSTSSSALALDSRTATSRSGVTVPVEVIINTTSTSFTSPTSSVTVAPGDFAAVFTPIGGVQTVLGGALPSDSYVPSSWVGANGVPKQLIFGWVASTGGSTEVHEVNSVNVVSLNPVPVLQVSQEEYAPTTTAGSPVTYTDNVTVGSSGASESQPVTVTDTLPTGVTPINGGGNGWVCPSPVGQQLSCTYTPSSPLAPGTSLPPLYINGTNTSGLPSTSLQANNVTVASSSDANPSYTSTSTQTSSPPPLPTTTAVSPSSGPIAGGTTVTLSGTNLNLATTVAIGASSQITGGTAATLNLCPTGVQSDCFTLSGQNLTLYMPSQTQGTLQVVAEEQGQYSGSTVSYTYIPPISITGSSTAISETTPAGSAFTFTPGAVVGGVGALSWSATGLPAGLLIDPLTGVISGIPTTPGVYTIVSTVRDSTNAYNTETLTLTVTGAANTPKASVPTGSSTQNYSGSVAIQNAPAGTSYSITNGALPTGLSLNSANGAVTGTPSVPGRYTFEVTASSPSGGSAVYTYTLTINGPPNTSHGIAGTSTGKGYWTTTSSGQVETFGDATSYGSTASLKLNLNQPVVGLEANYTGNGYWQVASDGGVFAFGASNFYGSMASTKLNGPVEGLVPTLDGSGYWLVATDGGVFAFGDATFYGSMASTKLNGQVVGIESTPDGNGYWLVAADGGVFAFGDATFYGSLGATKVTSPIVAIASTLDGKGYWLVSATGQVFTYGDAISYGSLASTDYVSPISGISVTNDGLGYWLIAQNGAVYAYGDAKYYGAPSGSGTVIP